MADDFSIEVTPYQILKERGAQPPEVFAQAKEDGLSAPNAVKILRELFGMSLPQAVSVMHDLEGKSPLPWYQTHPIGSSIELRQVLQDELGFCGSGADDEAIQLLRDVLRFARARYDPTIDAATREQSTKSVFSQLCYENSPGLATWFLYFLDHRDFIMHGNQIGAFMNTHKGDWLLNALEQFDPCEERSVHKSDN